MLRSSARVATFTVFLVLLLSAQAAYSQQPPAPWSGVLGRESDDPNLPWNVQHRTFKDAISDDGRYVVFKRGFDLNAPGDIYLRDRYTTQARKLNTAWDGSEPYAPSDAASISGNGKHVVFMSWGRLTADDVNDVGDLYVRDLENNTITRISVGPEGQEPVADAGYGSITNDGRFVAFTAQFDAPYPGLPRYAWLRDRDPDHNGIFDEPGTATTTLVSVKTDGTPATAIYGVAINGGTAQYVAFTSSDPDVVYTPAGDGVHMYVRDLQNALTVRIDAPPAGAADDGWASWPSFSDDGRWLVYESTARLSETDVDAQSDVFVFDMWTGGNVQIVLSEDSGQDDRIMLPAISGDGRYVAAAADLASTGAGTFFAWVYDRETRQATRIVPKAEGSLHPPVLELSLTFDGSELLFWSDAYGVVHQYWPYGTAVFVWSPFSLTPSEQTVPAGGGTFTATVSAPPNVAWTVTSPNDAWITIQPASGNGPGTFTFTVPPNTTNESHTGYIWIGSEQIVVTQSAAPSIADVWPWDGPVTGGTTVSVVGGGFVDGAVVTFDGVAATTVTVVNGGLVEAVTPAHPRSGPVEVRVTNPDGLTVTRFPGFRYRDDTPPVVEFALEGTLGSNGYYRGDVTITWTVTDAESDFSKQSCETRTFTEDGLAYQFCQAESEGGTTARWATVPRDATGPVIDVYSPWYPPAQVVSRYPRGSVVSASYSCTDAVSGMASCTGTVPNSQNLDTSTAGALTFTVQAEDMAGNRSTKAIPYVVVAPTVLTMSDASGTFGGATSLVARLTSDGHPLAGRPVTFSISGTPVGSAATDATGAATLPLSLVSRWAGVYLIAASVDEADIYAAASATAALTVNKVTPSIVWAAPADIAFQTALSGAQLNASANVPGTFAYSPAFGAILPAGVHTLTTTFTPTDTANYSVASTLTTLRVTKAVVTLTWASPAPIGYGTPLSTAQLNASASVPGVFSYTPALGAALPAGSHVLAVAFVPTDSQNYQSASNSVSLSVTPTPLTIRANDAAKAYGQPLPGFSVNASGFVYGETVASLAGSLSFSTSASTFSAPGTYSVTPSGLLSPNYTTTFAAGVLTVSKATTTLTLSSSPNPSANNKPVQLTAHVAVIAPGGGAPTGSVTFRDGTTVLGSASIVNGVATLTTSFRKGTHQLTATWGGDANFVGASGSATHKVN